MNHFGAANGRGRQTINGFSEIHFWRHLSRNRIQDRDVIEVNRTEFVSYEAKSATLWEIALASCFYQEQLHVCEPSG